MCQGFSHFPVFLHHFVLASVATSSSFLINRPVPLICKNNHFLSGRLLAQITVIQVNLDMTDSMGPGKLVRHMQNPSYAYDEYLICIGLGPSISSVICKNLSYSGPSYPSSPVYFFYIISYPL